MAESSPQTAAPRPASKRLIWLAAGLVLAGLVVGGLIVVLSGGRNFSGERVEVALPPPPPGAAPDPALLEDSPDGKLPIVAADGRQAWQVYAGRFNAADVRPRLAIVVSGLGLDAANTQAAITRLPPVVTLAFSPYAHDLAVWIAAARQAGHEVLLGLPMEPADYPRQDPGPETLLATLDPGQNLARLHWVMGRGTTYVGLIAIMGDRFESERGNLQPVFDELKKRGLMFVDNQAAAASVAAEVAHGIGLPWAMTDRRLDGEATGDAIDRALGELETAATQDGAALGLGGLYPVTLDRVIAWAPTLERKGIALAPASAVAGHQAPPQKPPPGPRPRPGAAASASCCSMHASRSLSAGASTFPTPGRCLKAASTTAKARARRHGANSRRKPASSGRRSSPKARNGYATSCRRRGAASGSGVAAIAGRNRNGSPCAFSAATAISIWRPTIPSSTPGNGFRPLRCRR